MWWCPEGQRVLRGAEWDLFRVGLSTLWDDIESSGDDEDPGTTGIKAFDNLPRMGTALPARCQRCLDP